MSAGAFSNDEVVKAAAENVIAVYIDCSRDGQNSDMQEKYKIAGYPTLLIVDAAKEKILEDLYPQNGGKFAKQLVAFGKKYGTPVKKAAPKKSWINGWQKSLKGGKKPLMIIFAEKDKKDEWADVEKWLKAELKDDYSKLLYAYSLKGSKERAALLKKLGKKDEKLKDTFVVVDPTAKDPFKKPLADPGKISEKKMIETLKKTVEEWSKRKKK